MHNPRYFSAKRLMTRWNRFRVDIAYVDVWIENAKSRVYGIQFRDQIPKLLLIVLNFSSDLRALSN